MPASPIGLRIALLLLASGSAAWVFPQCGNDNVQTGTAVTPNCPGTTTISCVQGGQYALVNVVAGNTYTFSTCGATFDTQITLYNNTGGPSIGYNDDACGLQSTVTWTATFTGQVRVLVDQYFCTNGTTCAPLEITCTTPPAGDCVYTLILFDSFSDGWGTSFVGVSINGSPFTNYTIGVGFASVSYQIGVNIGDIVVLNYDASGTWQTDNSYSLLLGGAALFNSGSPPAAGISFTSTVDCQPPPPAQEDCLGATTVCSNVAISNNTNNEGNIADIDASNSGCLDTQEYQGTWYIFSPSSSGDLGLSIAPQGPDDYDWAIWGPYPPGTTAASVCPPSGQPIRCAASSGDATFNSTGSYATGMGHLTFSPPRFASPMVSYGIPATTNICPLVAPQYCGWVPGLQVTAGQVYLLYISNWTQSSVGFGLDWTLENGASLDCTVLPVELVHFTAEAMGPDALLTWRTASEHGCSHFEVQRSEDAENFGPIGTVAGAGDSQTLQEYTFVDTDPFPGINYYRLKQVDLDGDHEHTVVRTVHFPRTTDAILLLPNPGTASFSLSLPAGLHPITVMDVTGRLMHSGPAWSGATIDTYDWPRGTYLVRLPELGECLRWVKE